MPKKLVSGLSASRTAWTRTSRARLMPRARAASMCGESRATVIAARVCWAMADIHMAATAIAGSRRCLARSISLEAASMDSRSVPDNPPIGSPSRAADASRTIATTTAGVDSNVVVTPTTIQSTIDPRRAAATRPSAKPPSQASVSAARFISTVFPSSSTSS